MVSRSRTAPTWEQVEAALSEAQNATEELATDPREVVQRRFGIVIARMELKKLFERGEEDGVVQGG